MTENKEIKCAHPACRCITSEHEKYCSRYCKDAGQTKSRSRVIVVTRAAVKGRRPLLGHPSIFALSVRSLPRGEKTLVRALEFLSAARQNGSAQ